MGSSTLTEPDFLRSHDERKTLQFLYERTIPEPNQILGIKENARTID